MLQLGAIAAAVIVTVYAAKVWNIFVAIVYGLLSALLIMLTPLGAPISLAASCIIYPIAQRRKLAKVMDEGAEGAEGAEGDEGGEFDDMAATGPGQAQTPPHGAVEKDGTPNPYSPPSSGA